MGSCLTTAPNTTGDARERRRRLVGERDPLGGGGEGDELLLLVLVLLFRVSLLSRDVLLDLQRTIRLRPLDCGGVREREVLRILCDVGVVGIFKISKSNRS